MKHENKMKFDGSSAPGSEERGEANQNPAGVPVNCEFPEEAQKPQPVPVELPKGRALMADMRRRFTVPFAFDARQYCGSVKESPSAAKRFRRLMVMVAGATVLAAGLAMIVLPGPAFIVIPAGLAILALEFAWARRWLRSARALLPRRGEDSSSPRKRLTLESVKRGTAFLFRQVGRTLWPKKKLAAAGGVGALPAFTGYLP